MARPKPAHSASLWGQLPLPRASGPFLGTSWPERGTGHSSPWQHLDKVILAEVGELQVEVGEVEAQAVAGGCSQGPVLLLVVGILPWEARRCQAPKHGLGPLRASGCGCRATEQTQEDQQPEGGRGASEALEACSCPTPLPLGRPGGLPPTSWRARPAGQAWSGFAHCLTFDLFVQHLTLPPAVLTLEFWESTP